MAEPVNPPYVFQRGRRAIEANVLFPKKVEYQPEIFNALNAGLNQSYVRRYLRRHAEVLLEEMKEYPQLFDPKQYERLEIPIELKITPEEARERLSRYESHFYGWSIYEVDGEQIWKRGWIPNLARNDNAGPKGHICMRSFFVRGILV